MFGSDWPVCLLAANYSQVLDIIENFIEPLSGEEKRKIMEVMPASFIGSN